MQTRSSFLTTGLVPVVTVAPADDCTICACPFTDAVKLPCGHIFHKQCIEHWLNMRLRNSCPMCKRKLFDLSPNEDPRVGDDRRTRIAAALRTSGLSERNAVDAVESYGIRTLTTPGLQRATASATHYLSQTSRPGQGSVVLDDGSLGTQNVSGPAIVNTERLSAHFTAIGNLIPALAAAQGRQYSGQQVSDWKLVLTHLWTVLEARDRKKYDALVMPTKLRNTVKAQLKQSYSDVDYISFFFTYADPDMPNPSYDDFDLLLNYLTVCCWTAAREAGAAALAGKSKKTDKQFPRRDSKADQRCIVM